VTWFDAELNTELPLAKDFRSFIRGLVSASDFEDTSAIETSD
jgi:hypothetical protein